MTPLIGITCSTTEVEAMVRYRHGVNGSYIDQVARAGGTPVLLPNVDPSHVERLLDVLDGLLAAGGDDIQPLLFGAEPDPHLGEIDVPRDRFELPLLRAALAREIPILGICRGIQALNVARGGDLRQDLVHDPTSTVQHRMKARGGPTVHHTVRLRPGSRLHALLGHEQVAVNSYHHQAVGRLGDGLTVCATAADGVIEAVEGTDPARFLLGVQWHPEVMALGDPLSTPIFDAFLTAARGFAARRR